MNNLQKKKNKAEIARAGKLKARISRTVPHTKEEEVRRTVGILYTPSLQMTSPTSATVIHTFATSDRCSCF